MDMDLEFVKKVIKIAEEADISGLCLEKDGIRVEVRREKNGYKVVSPASQLESVPAAAAIPAEKEEAGVTAITSPMVGTFYRSPSQGSPPFVEVGDRVEAGKVTCIIEAMKLFNEIESEISGTITKILAENGQPVEYGQKLMLVKKE